MLEATEIQLSTCGILNYHIIYSLLFQYELKDHHYPLSYLDNLLLTSPAMEKHRACGMPSSKNYVT